MVAQPFRAAMVPMSKRQCHHCKEWIERSEPHDCWTISVDAATEDLADDLRDAWQRLHETASEFGDQRVYASHKSIMFARETCYFFVRPKRAFLEVVFFVGRAVKAPQIRRAERRSATKMAHTIHIRHRDEVEAPITDWLLEAYRFAGSKSGTAPKRRATAGKGRRSLRGVSARARR